MDAGRKRTRSASFHASKKLSQPIEFSSDDDFDSRPTHQLVNDISNTIKGDKVIDLSTDDDGSTSEFSVASSESSEQSDDDASMTEQSGESASESGYATKSRVSAQPSESKPRASMATSAAKASAANTSTANTSTANTSTANTSTANTSTAKKVKQEPIQLSDSEMDVKQSETPRDSTDMDVSVSSKQPHRRKVIENVAAKRAAAQVTRTKPEKPKMKPIPKSIPREERQDLMRRRREANVYKSIVANHEELGELWEDVDLSSYDPNQVKNQIVAAPQPDSVSVPMLPFQLEGLAWMIQQENGEYKGGILADEMGMGKTLQTIALFLSERASPTLVISPAVALIQWHDEIKKYTPEGAFKVMVYHGTDRTTDVEELKKHDIIITTYAIIENAFRKESYGFKRKGELVKQKSPLHAIDWARVCMDEAHSIKDRTSSTARSAFALKAERRWCLTGTPLQNRVGELYSLLRFLRIDPFAYYFCTVCSCKSLKWDFPDGRHCATCFDTGHQHFSFFNREILKPITNYGHSDAAGLTAMRKLNRILDKTMLRRTKVERADDLGLPPRVVVVKRDYFNELEEDFYTSLFSDAKRKFDAYVEEGTVLNHYASIFELLMKMRQAADHPDLVTKKALVAASKDADYLVCGICQEPCEDAIISKCHHTFCREDISQYVNSCAGDPKCPTCLRPLTIDLTQPEIVPKDATKSASMKTSIINYLDMSRWRSSTKIESLVEELTVLRSKDATIKSIVFSQFVNFLDLVSWRLKRAGFEVVRLDGKMSPTQRAAVIDQFNTDPNLTVFLISLKAGGVALNLTAASHVFLLDPWWNEAQGAQASGRIERIGQHRPVKTTHIIIENSIESKILQLGEKKRLLFESTVGKDEAALARLSEEDLGFLFC